MHQRQSGNAGRQLVPLVVLQAAIILAIRTLAGAVHRPANAPQTAVVALQPAADPAECLVLELQQALQTLLKEGKSYTRIAEQTDVSKAHLSMLINHFDRAKCGDRGLGGSGTAGDSGEAGYRACRQRLGIAFHGVPVASQPVRQVSWRPLHE